MEGDPNIWIEAMSTVKIERAIETLKTSWIKFKMALRITEVKYPKCDNWRHAWIFDHSSCHSAVSDDGLDMSKMSVFGIVKFNA